MKMQNQSALAKEFMENGKLISFPIIDAHAHMGANYGTYMSKATAAEMVEIMDRENIEMVFCSPHSALFDPGMQNDEYAEILSGLEAGDTVYYTEQENIFAFFASMMGGGNARRGG